VTETILRSYRTELDPNQAQRETMVRTAGTARFAYNWGYQSIEAFRQFHQLPIPCSPIPSAYDLHRELNGLKRTEFPWMYEVSKCAPQEALRNLGRAFKNMWNDLQDPSLCRGRSREHRRQCRKRHVRYVGPKARKHGIGSFRLTDSVKVETRYIQLPRIGRVRLKEKDYLPTRARSYERDEPTDRGRPRLLSVTVSERAGRWFVSVQVQEEVPEPQRVEGPRVGVDWNVSDEMLVAGDGTGGYVIFENPHPIRRRMMKVSRLNRQLSRKRLRSHNRAKARLKLVRVHMRVANARRDALHQATTWLTKHNSAVVIQAGNFSGMMADHSIAAAVADAAPREVIRQLEYKARWHGSDHVLADRWFPSTQLCSRCGALNDMPRGEKIYRCDECGLVLGRNQNASDNLSRWPSVRRSETAVEAQPNACESREVTGPQGPVPGDEAGIPGSGQGGLA
jgi:putative transposase